MAKKALLDVLEKTIGKYVHNLDAESLNVALWSGKIELNALELDCGAVNGELDRQAALAPNLAIPLRVTNGSFSHFEIEVPWAHLMSRPVIMRAKGLSVTVEPFDRSATADFLHAFSESENVRSKKIREARRHSIQEQDDYRKNAAALKKLAEQDIENTSATGSSFGARLVRRILENIQVEISNVHIALDSAEGSGGVVLDSLILVTTDNNGNKVFVDRMAQTSSEKSFLHKLLQINGLGIYLDEDELHALQTISEEKNYSEADHSFLLQPLSFEARLRQADSNVCVEFPKYKLASELHALEIMLSKNQLVLGQKIVHQMQPSDAYSRPLFPEYRPLARPSRENAKEWWKYAARCIGRLNGRRSWVEFFTAFQTRKRYIPLYKRHAHCKSCPWLAPLNPFELNQLEAIEQDRSISIDGLMTWRNIADAQVEKEQQKRDSSRKKASLFTSIFGGTEDKPDEVPVHLTVEEMKELEAVTLDQIADAELSKDSRLCDINFVLGAFTVNLFSYDFRPLTTLSLGAVHTNFDANADGSFNFTLHLTSLGVSDMVTPDSLFPFVLSNQARSSSSSEAFHIRIAKSKTGDQRLDFKLNTFVAIASPMLFREMAEFVSIGNLSYRSPTRDVLLAQSLSGSVDLFYDASEGVNTPLSFNSKVEPPSQMSTITDISEALIEAWKLKTESKVSLVVDLDIQAPILVIPENCFDTRSHALFFDLGHLTLRYGQIEAADKVSRWFEDNALQDNSGVDGEIFDSGSLKVSSLTFAVGRASDWAQYVKKHDDGDGSFLAEDDSKVIEPITAHLDFGIESQVVGRLPRVCLFGIIPIIAFSLSPDQVSRICAVSNAWIRLYNDLFPGEELLISDQSFQDFSPDQSESNRVVESNAGQDHFQQPENRWTQLHVDVRLKRMSLAILTDSDSGIEAHLVSVSLVSSLRSDGYILARLSMGYFFILDRLENDFPRKQRLLVHSVLANPPGYYAETGPNSIIDELYDLGVFEDDFVGSSDLADLIYQGYSGNAIGIRDPFSTDNDTGDGFQVASTLDAKFSALYMHWNPQVIKIIIASYSKFYAILESSRRSDTETLITTGREHITRQKKKKATITSNDMVEGESGMSLAIMIRAQMDNIHIFLNSAQDDLPLFIITMSASKASLMSSDENIAAFASLGDIHISTPETSRTVPTYRQVLGLASAKSESLLTVRYRKGKQAIRSVRTSEASEDLEAYGEVTLSPMRMVYLHSQIMALLEYSTQGILGALAAHVASTAVSAAAEISSSSGGRKAFFIRAYGFEIVIPEAAYLSSSVVLSVGTSSIEYTCLPHPAPSKIAISLSDLALKDSDSDMLEEPIKMEFNVIYPSESVGSKDDQAIRVDIQVSKASFTFTKNQYQQLLLILDKNITDTDLYVREENFSPVEKGQAANDVMDEATFEVAPGLTHAGVLFVENEQRIYVDVTLAELSLCLFNNDFDDPLISTSCVGTSIFAKMYPENQELGCTVQLRSMSCNDQRLKSIGRQYRALVYSDVADTDRGTCQEESKHVMMFTYLSKKNSTSFDLAIGSPRIVFIPDVVAEVLSFLETKKSKPTTSSSSSPELEATSLSRSSNFDKMPTETSNDKVSHFDFSLKTSKCCIILVDLGSDTLVQKSVAISSATETIVLGGIFEGKLSLDYDTHAHDFNTIDGEFHGEAVEAFSAFGKELRSPLQVLDPTKLSVYLMMKREEKMKSVDIRMASVDPLDICCSMRTVALVNAIISGFSDSFEAKTKEYEEKRVLSENEANQIQQLVSLLETDDNGENIIDRDSLSVATTSDAVSSVPQPSVIISLKITMPETHLTFVNDLQGLDDALLRISILNLFASTQIRTRQALLPHSTTFVAFDSHLHTSILGDYFDSSRNLWKPFFQRPWEVGFKGSRGISKRYRSARPSTTIDVESFPCHVSFSEQFLTSLASAKTMWSVYTAATKKALDMNRTMEETDRTRRSMVATAARTFISSLPYAIENHSGIDVDFIINDEEKRSCSTGSIEYFRIEPPKTNGFGGKRAYGQDVHFKREVLVLAGETSLPPFLLGQEFGQPARAHKLADGSTIMTAVRKEGKTIVIHISSGFEICNKTFLSFGIHVTTEKERSFVGYCEGLAYKPNGISGNARRSSIIEGGRISKVSSSFGLPAYLINPFCSKITNGDSASLHLSIAPCVPALSIEKDFIGEIPLEIATPRRLDSDGYLVNRQFDVTCRPVSKSDEETNSSQGIDPMVCQIDLKCSMIDGKYPAFMLQIYPRAEICNNMPIGISVQSPMPHIFGRSFDSLQHESGQIYDLSPGCKLEVFTPGPSIAISLKCSETPVGGMSTDWLEGKWVDLPLITEFRLCEPIKCFLPFSRSFSDPLGRAIPRGTEIFIAEGRSGLQDLSLERSTESQSFGAGMASDIKTEAPSEGDSRTFYVTVCHYAVDHMGDILFEIIHREDRASFRRSSTGLETSRSNKDPGSVPFGAFRSPIHRGRITLLPGSTTPIRFLHLTMEGHDGLRRSGPFKIEDISICEGGVDSTPLAWEDGSHSGVFAYRKLLNSFQSEIHFVPEYVIYNGSSKFHVYVHQDSGAQFPVPSRSIAALRRGSADTVTISLEYPSFGGRTASYTVDSLGIHMAIIKYKDGSPLGSVAVQTVVGAQDSRLVVKLGEVKFGSNAVPNLSRKESVLPLKDDLLRFRIQWSELLVTLSEARIFESTSHAFAETALDNLLYRGVESDRNIEGSPQKQLSAEDNSKTWVAARKQRNQSSDLKMKSNAENQDPVSTIMLHRFTIDWQRVFKEEGTPTARNPRDAPGLHERSQLSVIVHNVQIKDETPDSPFPIVFDSSSDISFLDLCIRFRGPIDTDLVKVDLFDLNLAHANGVSKSIIINTNEDFLWKILDLANRILLAAGEFAGVQIELQWDDQHDGYTVSFSDKKPAYIQEGTEYTPPQSDKLFDLTKVRVSPFTILLSFKRNPQASRYKVLRGVKGANLLNYFTRRLKFKIERAALNFSRYESSNIKGPLDRLAEILSTVYMSRMKLKLVTIMTAASFQDWKYLASRDSGDDEFVEGDILRVTGNLAGNTANYVLNKAAGRLGSGVSAFTNTVGEGIESASGAVGARAVGVGMNSIISGVGEGFGSTISGVGSGAGKVLRGTGQGFGHVFGGVTGGATMIGKGIGRGMTTGDGRAVASGVSQGVSSVGTGVGQGVESMVTGAAEGAVTVGQGLFSGVKSVGRGIGGAISACCSCCPCWGTEEQNHEGSLVEPLLQQATSADVS